MDLINNLHAVVASSIRMYNMLQDSRIIIPMAEKYPLLVQVEYYTGSSEADDTAKWLYRKFNDDPAVPGVRIPIYFTPNNGRLIPPVPTISSEADCVVVVLLTDDHLAAHAHDTATNGITWAEYVVQLYQFCMALPESYKFIPIQLTKNAYPIDKRLEGLNFLKAWDSDVDENRKFIARRLMNLLIRILLKNQTGHKGLASNQEFPPLQIFVSHTKLDLENEPRVVRSILEYLNAEHPEKTWFDSGDIDIGSVFKDAIERGLLDTTLLAILTDSYSSRSWCRREVLFAKQNKRPVVVVNAVQKREIRSFPYAGNTPVIRWNGSAQDALDLLLLETLRHIYAEETLNKHIQEGDETLPRSPELVTIVNKKCKTLLYPDPPLGSEELDLLSVTGIEIQTPLQRHALSNNLNERSLTIALSISPSEDLSKFGLCQAHLDRIYLEISRYLLLAGIRLAYGGHLQKDGYTVRLADLLHEPIMELHREKCPKEATPPTELVTYIAWPMLTTDEDVSRLGPLVEIRQCDRPPEINETINPIFIAHPSTDISVDNPLGRFAWARGLSLMRTRQTSETNARIVLGGKLGQKDYPYKGMMPGVLEEALLSIQYKKPLYIIGAFGGCARLIIDAIEGYPREELTWKYQSAIPYSDEVRKLYKEYKLSWKEFEDIASMLQQRGYQCLNNGLSVDANRELASTRSVERIVELIFSGLNRVTK
jgi:hypothetical protein